MWKQADVHYRRSDDLGREVGAFLLTNGKVLVLPDYDNEYDTSKIGAYGYKLNGTSTADKRKREVPGVSTNTYTSKRHWKICGFS